MMDLGGLVLIQKYCRVKHNVTWHLLCIGGVLQCLECYLEDNIDPGFDRYEIKEVSYGSPEK